MSRGKAWLRHQRRRVVARRYKILKRWWGPPENPVRPRPRRQGWDDHERRHSRPGRLSKWNLVCSCGMCTMGKREGKRQDRHDAKVSLRKGEEPYKKIKKR